MSKKTIINIKSLTINLNGETISRGFGIPSGLIAALVSGFASQPDAEVGTSGEANVETTAPAEASNEAAPAADTVAEVTPDDVLRFLTSDTRYELRTADSIRKHFGDRADEAMDQVDDLVTHGMVGTKRQRGSGLTLYRALATPAPAATEPAPVAEAAVTPELDETSVRTFLGSDERYKQRTAKAIAKHFGVDEDETLGTLLYDMTEVGDIQSKTRRSDGATLFSLA